MTPPPDQLAQHDRNRHTPGSRPCPDCGRPARKLHRVRTGMGKWSVLCAMCTAGVLHGDERAAYGGTCGVRRHKRRKAG